jgi:hypothetical protein
MRNTEVAEMIELNRREFLAFMALVGVSASTSPARWRAHRQFKVGMAEWNAASQVVAVAFRQIPELGVAAVAGVTPRTASLTEWRASFPNDQPEFYPDVTTMLKRSHFDFLYANAPDRTVAESAVHLLLEDPNPSTLVHLSASPAYIQILPRYEFSGFSRLSSMSGEWMMAIIDCRSTLPNKPFQNQSEFAAWLYREIGEAIDFACELVDIGETHKIFAVAAPAESPYAAKFGWHIAGRGPCAGTIDVSVSANHSPTQSGAIRIILRGARESVVLHSIPRSVRLTHVLTSNLIDAISSANPQNLVYRPSVLTRSHDLVTKAALSL